MNKLKQLIEQIYHGEKKVDTSEFNAIQQDFVNGLNKGEIRAAEPSGDVWKVNPWVKKGILLGFKFGTLADYSINESFHYFDKHTYPLHPFSASDNVRIVPGGTSLRTGSYLAAGIVIMPPVYVNVGAYIAKDTMLDSHVLVGSCAQIGARVHLSAGVQIGGVLEPVGAMPVIIEDDVLIGGNCGVYEGTIVKHSAVLGAGTILTASIPVYDVVNNTVLRAAKDEPLVIPANAVVVPGSRPLKKTSFARENQLHLNCAMIVKYRDNQTNAATALEEALR
jgi:2,3,4,5-tetrahydropyridine-2-carboxylate N-succinyltransferase